MGVSVLGLEEGGRRDEQRSLGRSVVGHGGDARRVTVPGRPKLDEAYVQKQAESLMRYADGHREASHCKWCGSPVWIVYHGANANHTMEPRRPEDT